MRLSLGPDPRGIARTALGRGLALALAGGDILAGLLLHSLAAPLLRAFLFGVTARDPPTRAGAPRGESGGAKADTQLASAGARRAADFRGVQNPDPCAVSNHQIKGDSCRRQGNGYSPRRFR